jgi:pimeloyl-ACP methyl ester carboxylesterase
MPTRFRRIPRRRESSRPLGARVPRFAPRLILVAALAVFTVTAPLLASAHGAVASRSAATPSYIVVGFVGGFVSHDNPRHGTVLLAQRIRHSAPKDTYIQVFENRRRKTAYRTILRLLDRNHDGVLNDDEKAQARIILFGHSWGAAAVVLLARELNRAGIPVLLTVQVDSVAKLWQKDGVIPENVAAAVNFYQPHGLIHGRSQIAAANASKTQVLGNYRFDYQREPVKCEAPSWFDRIIAPSHAQSECDPRLWAQVEDLVRQRLEPQPTTVAASPQP